MKPIVILPGWQVNSTRYADLVNNLERFGFATRVISFPGFPGGFKLKNPFRLDDYVSYTARTIRKSIGSSVVIAGHSFGGRVGIRLAAKEPSIVSALILSGAPGFPAESSIKLNVFKQLSLIGKKLMEPIKGSNLEKKMRSLLYQLAGNHDYLLASSDQTLKQTFLNVISDRLEKDMDLINCPTLLLWGNNDRTVPLSVATKIKNAISKSKFIVVEGASHSLPFSNAEKVAQIIDSFVRTEK